MQYLELRKEGGNLVIVPLPAGREEIEDAKEQGKNIDSDEFMFNLLEHNLGNGWESIAPEEIGALTDGLILTDDCQRNDDDGKLTHLGRVYWHERYQIESIAGELDKHGRYVIHGRD